MMSAARIERVQEPCLMDQPGRRGDAARQHPCSHGRADCCMTKRRRRAHDSAESESQSLVDWREPAENMSVLDWRRRGRQFGVLPIEAMAPEEEEAVVEPPQRLLAEEEPEAFADQS